MLFGSQHHIHGPTFKFRLLLDHRIGTGFFNNLVEHFLAHISQGDFPAPEHNRNFDLVFLFYESFNMAQLYFQVMFIGFGSYFYLFHLECGLLFFGFLLFFGLLIFEPAIIHNLANRRI